MTIERFPLYPLKVEDIMVSNEKKLNERLNDFEEIHKQLTDDTLLLGNVINVVDYGAIGDGVFDNLDVLKNLFEIVEDYTTIFFPNGTYLIGSGDTRETILKLFMKNNIKVVGESREFTKLILHPQTPALNRMGIINFERCDNCGLYNMELDGNSIPRYIANGEVNWGDEGTKTADCNNININGGSNITIKNIYSHHPMKDCLEIGRYAGGDIPCGEYCLIEDCVFDYGYRQGMSIVGWHYGIIRNTRITNTGTAINPNDPDGRRLWTSPSSGIDSETWVWNHNWLIDNCYFSHNRGGDFNMNDGASEHVIYRCLFDGKPVDGSFKGGIISETPSSGSRTLNNIVAHCDFRNTTIGIAHGVFTVMNNTFYIDNPEFPMDRYLMSLFTHELAAGRNGSCIAIGNRFSVRLDAYVDAGKDIKTMTQGIIIGPNVLFANNYCTNIIGELLANVNNHNACICNNIFYLDSTYDVRDVTYDHGPRFSTKAKVYNNHVIGNYPSIVKKNIMIDYQDGATLRRHLNEYKINNFISLTANNITWFKICKLSNFTKLHLKMTLAEMYTAQTQSVTHKIEYDILAYIQGGDIVQQANVCDLFNSKQYCTYCKGLKVINEEVDTGEVDEDGNPIMEVVEQYVCLGIANEYNIKVSVFFELTIHDVNSLSIDLDTIDFNNIYKRTSHEHEIYKNIVAGVEYLEGDYVESAYGHHLYQITKGGVATTAKTLQYAKSESIGNISYQYIGPNRLGDTLGTKVKSPVDIKNAIDSLDYIQNFVNNYTSSCDYEYNGTCNIYINSIEWFKICKLSDFNELRIKLCLSDAKSTNKHRIEYDILAYKNSQNEIIQQATVCNVFNVDSYCIYCKGLKVINEEVNTGEVDEDGNPIMEIVEQYVCLGIANEYFSRENVYFDIQITDNSVVSTNLDEINLKSYYKREQNVLNTRNAEVGEYAEGDVVKSNYGEYAYKVTTGGTVSTKKVLQYPRNETVDGVVFTYIGYRSKDDYGVKVKSDLTLTEELNDMKNKYNDLLTRLEALENNVNPTEE